MTVLLPDWENWGKSQIIMTMSTKINYLCASASRWGKSVAMLRLKQREHVGPVLCVRVGESHNRDAGFGRMGRGVLWASGTHVTILAPLCSLCLWISLSMLILQSRDAWNKNLYVFAVLVGSWAHNLVFCFFYLILFQERFQLVGCQHFVS